MTISDTERREVARRLRELEKIVYDPENTYELLADALGVDDFEGTDELFNRLADLIEPEPERTCRDVGGGSKFVCSKCGASFDYEGRWDEPTFWVDDVAAAVEYCPNCGAKVVYE